MTDKQDALKNNEDLRRRAEGITEPDPAPTSEPLSAEQARQVLHELRVHQVELEMQNEELRRAQAELEESRARYFDLYNLAPAGYLTLSAKGIILEANLKAASLLGTERRALTGKRFSAYVCSEDQNALYQCRRRLFETGAWQACDLRMVRRGGALFWTRLEHTVAADARPESGVVRIVLSDITELKQVEASLRASQAALIEANRELRSAHAALDARAGQLRLLAGDLTLTEQRERRRLSQVLHDGLQQHLVSAKMRISGIAEQIAAADLRQALDEVEAIIDESVKISKSLSVEISPPILHAGGLEDGLEWLARWMRDRHRFDVELAIETRPELNEDVKVLVFESVRELLQNAFKHGRVAGARVSLEQADAATLRVVVSDAGAGFDPGRLTPPGDEGAGLGLFSIRERIGLIGGRLEIQSAPAQGSRFTLLIPAPPAPAAAAGVPRPAAAAGNSRAAGDAAAGAAIRVLLVDDHALFRNGLARLLKKDADLVVVGHAADGQEAIDLAATLDPEVILMDISMPNVNGIEATQVIHRDHPHIRILGLSMYEDEERAQAMRAAGACAYKSKGCSAAELIAAVKACRRPRPDELAASPPQ
jgi:PAS domain S-box-containing protein